MKTTLSTMKKTLILLLIAMCLPLAAVAQEAYVVYNNGTLTFYYDNNRSSRTGDTYDLDEIDNDAPPKWIADHKGAITQVKFDSSFANARPKSTYFWFYDCSKLNKIVGIEYLNTSEVTNMSFMFSGCFVLENLDVSNYDTRNVTCMRGMFDNCRKLKTLDLSKFDTRNVTDMHNMFDGCNNLANLDVSNFDTRNVTNMEDMFSGCFVLENLDLSSFDTRNVTNMEDMFRNCKSLTTIYVSDGWHLGNVKNSNNMFEKCYNLVGGQGTTYDESKINKWYAHVDGGPNDPGYFTQALPKPYVEYNSGTLTFHNDGYGLAKKSDTYRLGDVDENGLPQWIYDHGADIKKVVFDAAFADARPTSTRLWFGFQRYLQQIEGINYLNTSEVTDMSNMFSMCVGLTTLDLSDFDTRKVTNMSYMFAGCLGLTTIFCGSNWNTDKVTMSENMFFGCSNLVGGRGTMYDETITDKTYAHFDEAPLDPGYLSAVPYAVFVNDRLTFYYDEVMSKREGDKYRINDLYNDDFPYWVVNHAGYITKVVFDSSFAYARPTSTRLWFGFLRNLQQIEGIKNLNTSEVTDMSHMFFMCEGLTTLGLSDFDTRKVMNMSYMFANCVGLTALDLSGWNTPKLTDTRYMFVLCSNLETIYCGDGWNTDKLKLSEEMFNGCTKLVGGKGTKFDEEHTNKDYAHEDGGPSNPGYFTKGGMLGDVNLDGCVDVRDMAALLDAILKGVTASLPSTADVTADGDIDVRDMAAILNIILGN